MQTERHGLAIGLERTGEQIFLSLRVSGKLSHADYEQITPMLESGLKSALDTVGQPRIRALVDATELQGWEARAAWDDFRLGLKHGREFERIAIVGNRRWQEWAAKIAGWFTSGDSRFFESEADALQWLQE
jgi:hypothetical protein